MGYIDFSLANRGFEKYQAQLAVDVYGNIGGLNVF